MERKRGIVDLSLTREAFGLQHDLLAIHVHAPQVRLREFTTDHHGNQLVRIQVRNSTSPNGLAVTKHGGPVTEREDFLKLVRHEHHGHAAFLQIA